MSTSNYLRRHAALVGDLEDDECRLCMEGEESSFHLVAECPALARTRLSIFGDFVLEVPLQWSRSQVTSFLRVALIGTLFDPDAVE